MEVPVAYHPLNLIFRFVLEILAVSVLAFWGWAWGGSLRWVFAIGVAATAMVVWAVFRAPGDKSSGEGLVTVPGPVRLGIELTIFGLAILALFNAHANSRADVLGLLLGIAVVIHYALSWDRIRWLLTA